MRFHDDESLRAHIKITENAGKGKEYGWSL